MIEHIRQFANLIHLNCKKAKGAKPKDQIVLTPEQKIVDISAAVRELVRELNGLPSIDFEPASRSEFLRIRGNLAYIGEQPPGGVLNLIEPEIQPLLNVLGQYRGVGSGGMTRSFQFVADKDLLFIVERDYAELTLKLFPSAAWKSTVVLAGSILEAILYAKLSEPKWNSLGLGSSKAPTTKGKVWALDDWKLFHYIEVSVDIGLLPKETADTIHEVLREYRNLIHPLKEKVEKYPCGDAEGMLSLGALNSVCNYLEANP